MSGSDSKRPQCPVFYPSMADMAGSFEDYIVRHEKRFAGVGICKIVAPSSWTPRKAGYTPVPDMHLARPIRQHATGSKGTFRMLMLEAKPMHLEEFATQAMSKENCCNSTTQEATDIERRYWQSMHLRPPLYGADIAGSLFDEGKKGWNLRRLDTVLSTVLKEAGHSLPGVNSPYLYFGTWRTTFAWHTEDMDLYSVNYLHYGATKHWYCIPPEHRARFETLCQGIVPDLFRTCPEFFRHKELLISPSVLDTNHIPYVKVVQNPREFVITFPGAYHAGFNSGYNCAESVNFGTRRWIPIGAFANSCTCAGDTVHINMKLFRHLVPKRLLPEDIFDDTSSEEEDSDDEDGSAADDVAAGTVGAESSSSSSEEEEESEEAGGKKRRRGKAAAAAAPSKGKQQPKHTAVTPVNARVKAVPLGSAPGVKKGGKPAAAPGTPAEKAKAAAAASAARVQAALSNLKQKPLSAAAAAAAAAAAVKAVPKPVTPRKRPTADSRAPLPGGSTGKRQKTGAGTPQAPAGVSAKAAATRKGRVAKPLPPRVLGVRTMPSRVTGALSLSALTPEPSSQQPSPVPTASPHLQAPALMQIARASTSGSKAAHAQPAHTSSQQRPAAAATRQQQHPHSHSHAGEGAQPHGISRCSTAADQPTPSQPQPHLHPAARIQSSRGAPHPAASSHETAPTSPDLSHAAPGSGGARHRKPSAIAVLAAADAAAHAAASPTRRRQPLGTSHAATTSPTAQSAAASLPAPPLTTQQHADRPARASARASHALPTPPAHTQQQPHAELPTSIPPRPPTHATAAAAPARTGQPRMKLKARSGAAPAPQPPPTPPSPTLHAHPRQPEGASCPPPCRQQQPRFAPPAPAAPPHIKAAPQHTQGVSDSSDATTTTQAEHHPFSQAASFPPPVSPSRAQHSEGGTTLTRRASSTIQQQDLPPAVGGHGEPAAT
ncbi:MAG: hypothetical protein WDW38_006897 [Sanguina aurantia]